MAEVRRILQSRPGSFITRLLCCELMLENEYLKAENKILKFKIKGRMAFTDDERRTFVEAALAKGKDMMQDVVSIVKPETILTWQRKLEKQKWDYSGRKVKKLVRPVGLDVEQLVC